MSSEQVLLTKWRNLSQDKQKQVLDFMDFLYWQNQNVTINTFPSETVLEKRLQQIRTKITGYSDKPL
ncbi:MAG: hypothetical protein KME59_13740 [Trichormus sp. ATA11-4-KO1]|jgi:hypothetical protein|nr:hypothetical protein [Trichormus sp. ATA11-4-KO1]